MFNIFNDSPEYEWRKRTPFTPTKITLSQVHASIPKYLHKKSTCKALQYVLRDLIFVIFAYQAATRIDSFSHSLVEKREFNLTISKIVSCTMWSTYWWWQGIIFTGCWILGHEAGHGTLSSHNWVNHVVGFLLHTCLLVPYYSWRSSHQAHHKATSSVERDENYVPRTRAKFGLPAAAKANIMDYHDIFDETPIYTLFRMLIMQFCGWYYYLLTDALGSPRHPPGTNHFYPSSTLFKIHERKGIIASNVGLLTMALIFCYYTYCVGLSNFIKLYLIPFLLANHWIVMITFLHHSDPTIPHYRNGQWSFLRGAIATVDRPFLGWVGRFFFHNISHDHIAHHIFSSIPFYNQPLVTQHLKQLLRDDYNYDSTNTFRALHRSFTECCFIEDEGDIVFYKNKSGRAARQVDPSIPPIPALPIIGHRLPGSPITANFRA